MITAPFVIMALFHPSDVQKERAAEGLMASMAEDYVREEYRHLVAGADCRIDPAFVAPHSDLTGIECRYSTACGTTERRLVWFQNWYRAHVTADLLSDDLAVSCPEMLNAQAWAGLPGYAADD